MNREIEFRAWDLEAEQMLPNVQNHIGPVESAFGGLLKNPRYVIQQYTGRKDKNKVKIFEGSIVRYTDYNGLIITAVIKWDAMEAAFEMVEPDKTEGSGDSLDIAEHIEAIGNIYENPELLESGEQT